MSGLDLSFVEVSTPKEAANDSGDSVDIECILNDLNFFSENNKNNSSPSNNKTTPTTTNDSTKYRSAVAPAINADIVERQL